MAVTPQSYRTAAKYVRARERAAQCGRLLHIECGDCDVSETCCLYRKWKQADRALSMANGKEMRK